MKFDFEKLKKENIVIPFLTTIVVGLLTHLPVMVNDFPNSDAMTNFYFDQNMVTSGRWFLTVACGITSYFDLKWINAVLSVVYLAVAAVLLVAIFEVKDKIAMGLIGALLVTFPAVTATFAYMYTADGYYMGFALAVLAVFLTKQFKKPGWIFGGIALSFSLGIYQAYLAATILLCLFDIILACAKNRDIRETLTLGLRYLGMGVLGGISYYVILKICLLLQHKQMDTYQGLDHMGKISVSELPQQISAIYHDFAAFALKGNIFFQNYFSLAAAVVLCVVAICALIAILVRSKAYRKWNLILLILVCAALIPLGTNIVLLMSSDAYYHLLMRMQWALFPVMAVVLAQCAIKSMEGDRTETVSESEEKTSESKEKTSESKEKASENKDKSEERKEKSVRIRIGIFPLTLSLLATVASILLIWQFVLEDNIAYFNMRERYEKTYAYCLRLIDRMEQTDGYYTGMPVAMIGVVDEEKYPVTDITGDVTNHISGTTGDILVYKGEQYFYFMKNYMGFTFNIILDGDRIVEIAESKEYEEMDSFPAKDSVKIVKGVMYIKTEPPQWRQ